VVLNPPLATSDAEAEMLVGTVAEAIGETDGALG
jgi:hypothetical protein